MKATRWLTIGMFLLAGAALSQNTEQSAPQRIERSEAIAVGNLTDVVAPQYPGGDVEKGITGKVVLQIVIDKEGKVVEAWVTTGHPILAAACLDAVKQWKFRPYVLNNTPVEVETTVTIEFISDPPYVVTPQPLRRPMRIRLSAGVAEGNLIRRVDPLYPAEAKANHIQGDVVLRATIDKDGNVANLKPIEGDPLLAEAAMAAASQWKYRPYLLNGQPIEVETAIRIRFHL